MMTIEEFEKRLADIKAQETKYNVKINFGKENCIDKDHLDCTWYGGEVGTIEMADGYVITIGAYGDIRLGGMIDSEEIYIKDKNNLGIVYDEIGHDITDDDLYRLCESDDANNYLSFENNNWFEVDIITPNGKWIDLCGADNVLDDNILDCFADISQYFDYVEWAKGEN